MLIAGRISQVHVIGWIDDPDAKVVRPDTIHDRFSKIRIVWSSQPTISALRGSETNAISFEFTKDATFGNLGLGLLLLVLLCFGFGFCFSFGESFGSLFFWASDFASLGFVSVAFASDISAIPSVMTSDMSGDIISESLILSASSFAGSAGFALAALSSGSRFRMLLMTTNSGKRHGLAFFHCSATFLRRSPPLISFPPVTAASISC